MYGGNKMKVTEELIKQLREANDPHIADAYPYYFSRFERQGHGFYYCSYEALQHP